MQNFIFANPNWIITADGSLHRIVHEFQSAITHLKKDREKLYALAAIFGIESDGKIRKWDTDTIVTQAIFFSTGTVTSIL